MTRRRKIAAGLTAFAAGLVGAFALAGGFAGAAPTAWVLHLTSPSGDVLNTTITVPTTTTTSSSTTSTSTSTTTTTVPTGNGYPVLAAPFSFDGDFDPSCQTVGSGAGSWPQDDSGKDHPGTTTIGSPPGGAAEGTCSAKFSTPGGSGTGRAELRGSGHSVPVTLEWEYLEWLPSESNNGPGHGVLQQTKQNGSGGGCFNGGLTYDKNTRHLNFSTVASCSSGSSKHDLGAPVFNVWEGVHVTETFSDSGHVTVQIDPDGPGPMDYATRLNVATDTLSGDNQVILRQGLYHDLDSHESHVYGDGFHVAR